MPRAPSPLRYAQAAFKIALERHELDTWQEDLRVLTAALESRELSALLDAPQVPAARKVTAIEEALGGAVGQLALNLLSILGSRNLAHLLPGIVDEYGRLLDVHRGIERAEVTSAVPLESEEQARIVRLLEELGGREVRISSTVDRQIIGGLIARVGDRVIDGSVRSRLAEMRRRIVERAS